MRFIKGTNFQIDLPELMPGQAIRGLALFITAESELELQECIVSNLTATVGDTKYTDEALRYTGMGIKIAFRAPIAFCFVNRFEQIRLPRTPSKEDIRTGPFPANWEIESR